MTCRQLVTAILERFGPPALTDFAMSDVPEHEGMTIGVFTLADLNGEVVLLRRKPIDEHPGIEG